MTNPPSSGYKFTNASKEPTASIFRVQIYTHVPKTYCHSLLSTNLPAFEKQSEKYLPFGET